MSRIGRLPIPVPAGVDVTIDGRHITVKGPKGELAARPPSRDAPSSSEDGTLRVERPADDEAHAQLHGLTRTLVANMVIGVDDGLPQGPRDHRRRLSRPAGRPEAAAQPGLQPPDRDRPAGRHQLRGREPHPPGGRRASTRSSSATSRPRVRATRKPEPYKGKGVRYAGEVIRRKAGKAGKIGGKK